MGSKFCLESLAVISIKILRPHRVWVELVNITEKKILSMLTDKFIHFTRNRNTLLSKDFSYPILLLKLFHRTIGQICTSVNQSLCFVL
jgi:hypothetical protein